MDIDRQDEDVVSHLTDAEIVSMVAPPTQEDDTGSGDEDVTNGEMEPPPVPTIKEAHAALDVIRCFTLSVDSDLVEDVMTMAAKCETLLIRESGERMKQKNITDFFIPPCRVGPPDVIVV